MAQLFPEPTNLHESTVILLVQIADSITNDTFLKPDVADKNFSIAPIGFKTLTEASHAVLQWHQNGYVNYPYKFVGNFIYNSILTTPFTSQLEYYWLVPIDKVKSIVFVTEFDANFVIQCYGIAQNISMAKNVVINPPD